MMYGVHEYGYLLSHEEVENAKEKLTEAGFQFSDNNDVVEFLGGIWLDDFTGTIQKLFKDSEEDYKDIPYEDDRIAILPVPEYPSFWNPVYWYEEEMIQSIRDYYNFPEEYREDLPEGTQPQNWLPEDDEPIRRNLYEITGITH
ncbi:MAG: hypothetical protein J6S14_15695 [Clostridia bacterium]|nr:hypothetical protein [Clostridia bacterium]